MTWGYMAWYIGRCIGEVIYQSSGLRKHMNTKLCTYTEHVKRSTKTKDNSKRTQELGALGDGVEMAWYVWTNV